MLRTPLSSSEAVAPGLRQMRLVATGLLVAMAALFLLARAFDPLHPAIGYVRAFAEAAMVGGLADWFAVTALFRHPLHLPIPHTAIIPRNKDRIASTLAQFLRDNFLTPKVVARRMQRLDVAGAAGRWLADPGPGRGRLRAGLGRLGADVLEALDQERLGGMVKHTIAGRLRALEIAPLLGRALEAAIQEDRHRPLLDGIVRWAAKILDANEHLIRQMVHERSGAVMRWTGLDETLANKIIEGLAKLIGDMAEDPGHPLRAKAEEGIAQLARDLQTDPARRAQVEAFKNELLDNPALADWWMGIWETGRASLLRVARSPDALLTGAFGDAMRQLGQTLQTDRRLAHMINRFARRTAVGAATDYGDGIVRLVSDTIKGWDAQTITGRLENAVGRDLQYIRINGTLVGGLVGVAIHTVDTLL
ncbi:DUF445 domain-containing protein [Sphingomonas kyeonggiensis]|uniref:Uncharacterized membrane-anchored protein YjiN (DUF445 family) n=1 Tax=Sphingomonas kyeonggiensis TaxID=1268553 RepID=A0A7W6NYU9_9SPHN|nr:DUF445 domain-containing protein [Sphingomonas kyeonggiensis]MBB4099984.1 uncharacterized membrane-anchored protein YjiN (DUF445 family) [Sphingomonas kyeonggiensis]